MVARFFRFGGTLGEDVCMLKKAKKYPNAYLLILTGGFFYVDQPLLP
jgi:hypothetical protein